MYPTLDEEVYKRMREGIDQRCIRAMKIEPLMARKEVVQKSDFHKIKVFEYFFDFWVFQIIFES